jgi:putative transposase
MNFYSERLHRRSIRIRSRDYSRDGYYFVTVCARNRENLFADFCVEAGLAPVPDHLNTQLKGQPQGLPLHKEIAPAQDFANVLILTTTGRIVEDNWRKIVNHTVKTDAFVIMPNHIHGIIIIKPHALGVGAGLAPAPDSPDNDQGQPQGLPLHKEIASAPALGTIIGAFKSRCVKDYLKYIDENDLNESAKIWQRNYYEHVIRDRKELSTIRNYIKSNPANWAKDEENPLNL